MKLLDLPRASGKTTKLIQWAQMADWTCGPIPTRAIIVPDMHQASYLIHEHGLRAVPASGLQGLRGLSNLEVAVDELDAVLARLIGAPVAVATRTGEK